MSDRPRLPEEFLKRAESLPGFDPEEYEKALEKSPVRALRINPCAVCEGGASESGDLDCGTSESGDLKSRAEEIADALPGELKAAGFLPDTFFFDFDHIGQHPLHHAGAFYVQEPSAACPVESVDIKPGMKVLDLCAAPGGKTTQAAGKTGPSGLVAANEVVPSRCRTLVGNIERLAVKNAVVTCLKPEEIAQAYGEFFDVVIVDAPCSGEGMFRKSAAALNEWSVENVLMCAQRQRRILKAAAGCVADGGRMVYSTCTFSLEENEMNVDWFLREHPGFKLVPVPAKIAEKTADGIFFDGCAAADIRLARRFYPFTGEGEGQFFAVMEKRNAGGADVAGDSNSVGGAAPAGGSSGSRGSLKKPARGGGALSALSPDQERISREFLAETVCGDCEKKLKTGRHNNNIIVFERDIPVPESGVFSCGVKLGEIKKGRLVPAHHFFRAYGTEFERKIMLGSDDEECGKYLRGEGFYVNPAKFGESIVPDESGESIVPDESGESAVSAGAGKCENPPGSGQIRDGWAAVLINGYAAGGAKITNGYAKNHYPKGLRRLT